MVEFDTAWQLLNYYQVRPRPPKQIPIFTLSSQGVWPSSPSLLLTSFLLLPACVWGVTHYVPRFHMWCISDKWTAAGHSWQKCWHRDALKVAVLHVEGKWIPLLRYHETPFSLRFLKSKRRKDVAAYSGVKSPDLYRSAPFTSLRLGPSSLLPRELFYGITSHIYIFYCPCTWFVMQEPSACIKY